MSHGPKGTAALRWTRWWLLALALVALVIATKLCSDAVESTSDRAERDPIHLKGGASLGLQITRDGQQFLIYGQAKLRQGDVVRVQLELAGPTVITVGLLQESGEWTAILVDTELDRGVHTLSNPIGVGPNGTVGWVVAGGPEVVQQATSTRRFGTVMTVRLAP